MEWRGNSWLLTMTHSTVGFVAGRSVVAGAAVLLVGVLGGDFGLFAHPKRITVYHNVRARGFGWMSLAKGA